MLISLTNSDRPLDTDEVVLMKWKISDANCGARKITLFFMNKDGGLIGFLEHVNRAGDDEALKLWQENITKLIKKNKK